MKIVKDVDQWQSSTGTTTAMYFATIHFEASRVLRDTLKRKVRLSFLLVGERLTTGLRSLSGPTRICRACVDGHQPKGWLINVGQQQNEWRRWWWYRWRWWWQRLSVSSKLLRPKNKRFLSMGKTREKPSKTPRNSSLTHWRYWWSLSSFLWEEEFRIKILNDKNERSDDGDKGSLMWRYFWSKLINHNRFSQDEGDLVMPVLTPRYLPTCSIELLEGLGRIASKWLAIILIQITFSDIVNIAHRPDCFASVRITFNIDLCRCRYSVHIQSHIAESLGTDNKLVKKNVMGKWWWPRR